ncbi:MAG: transglycosylase SLT domain-containing protein [Nitrospira sp.]|nr:transglycosylase SLT domain-containing protein [Nitrospira sp.]
MAAASAPAVEDPVRPEARIDFNDPTARSDLWQRLRNGYGIEPIDNARVRKWERYYAERPDYVARMTDRGGRYLFHVVEELEKRKMPLDLALLPFIESAFNPQAVSVARAAGMWQFMPSTGRVFDLTQNAFRDDRRDILASTRAALDYLGKLHDMFNGDWHLALAAYNWGEGNVQRALRRKRDHKADTVYESLRRMPGETRDYVPKLQAMKNIVADPAAFGLTLPPLENHPYFLSVPIERDIDVELAAKLAQIDLDEFQQLNPQMNRPVILAAGTPQVLLPYDGANAFVRNLPQAQGPLASWTVWVAPKAMKPAQVAELVGMSEAELRDVNHIPPSMVVQAGSSLVVPRPEERLHDVPEDLAENGRLLLTPEGRALRRVSFRAGRRGDSVVAVARRYRVRPETVAHWNNVSVNARFRPGQHIVVMVATKPARAPARKSAAKAARVSAHKAAARSPRAPVRKAAAGTTRKPARRATAKAPHNGAPKAAAAARTKSSPLAARR